MHLQYYLPPKIGNELTETKYKRIKIMPALCFSPESFGNTERFRMFVMPNIASRIGSRITYVCNAKHREPYRFTNYIRNR